MLVSHAVLLAEARSYVAALADLAGSFDAAMDYERVLLQLDWLHSGIVPPTTAVPTDDIGVLYEVARTAITNLAEHGIDRLELAICLAMLEAAHSQDALS
ncbi:MAG: hypothetical protein ABIP03_12720 [Aquihabitans sp.]